MVDGDNTAESNKVLQVTSGSSPGPGEIGSPAETIGNEVSIGKLRLGAYSIILRMKTTSISSSSSCISLRINNNDGVTIKSVSITPEMFASPNTWECLSFGVNLSGNKNSEYKITFSRYAAGANATMNLDYIRIIPSGTALGSIG